MFLAIPNFTENARDRPAEAVVEFLNTNFAFMIEAMANRREHSPIDWEEAEQKLDKKIARILRGRKPGETVGASEAERGKTR